MTEGYPDRIIADEEIDSLKDLLLSQNLNFPGYPDWVEKAVREIREGKRQAFGLFVSELCGDGVIKVSASRTVELKNFYIKDKSRKSNFGSMLLEFIENYCIERGYSQIQVDIDTTDINTTRFFLGKEFEFQSRGDFYGMGKERYLLLKKLKSKYIGDYDWIGISKWVVEHLWGFSIENEIEARKRYAYNRFHEGMNIAATVLIEDDLNKTVSVDEIQAFCRSNDSRGILSYFAPQFAQEAKEFAKENGINIIDRDNLEELSGFAVPKTYEEAAGLIVIVKPEYYERLKESGDRVFLKEGHPPFGIKHGQIILFYNTSPVMGIIGYAIIKNISTDNPGEIWKRYSSQSAFLKDDWSVYAQGKSWITAYSFEEIKGIHKIELLKIREILDHGFNHQGGQRITVNNWENIKKYVVDA